MDKQLHNHVYGVYHLTKHCTMIVQYMQLYVIQTNGKLTFHTIHIVFFSQSLNVL